MHLFAGPVNSSESNGLLLGLRICRDRTFHKVSANYRSYSIGHPNSKSKLHNTPESPGVAKLTRQGGRGTETHADTSSARESSQHRMALND